MKTEWHFEVSGAGEIPLICIHGWACAGDQFLELSRWLAKDFRIYRLDLPGHGQTPLNDFLPSFEHYTEAIVDFIGQHNLDRPVLLGHSMGGVLSLIAAASGRLQPRAIVNLDGSLPALEKTQVGLQMVRGWLDEPNFRGRLAALLRETFFLPNERDARCEAILQTMCSAPDAVLRFMLEQAPGLQPEQILSRITAPVLFVGSAVARFDAPQAAILMPQLRVERISKTGHFLQVYAPEKLAALLGNFLTPEIVR